MVNRLAQLPGVIASPNEITATAPPQLSELVTVDGDAAGTLLAQETKMPAAQVTVGAI
jgi:hypothetical protein